MQFGLKNEPVAFMDLMNRGEEQVSVTQNL